MQWREIEAGGKVFVPLSRSWVIKPVPREEEPKYWKRKVFRRVFQTGFHPL